MLFTARAPNDNRFERHPRSSDMLITVSGPPGSGKSTNAAGLADRLGLDHVSGGDIFREMAAERDMTPVEFNEFAEEDPRSTEIWTVDSTRSPRPATTSCWSRGSPGGSPRTMPTSGSGSTLPCRPAPSASPNERRSPSTARKRRPSAARPPRKKRYREYYDIDIGDLSIYDAAYNTARWGPERFIDVLVATIDAYDPATDEGRRRSRA